MNKTKKKRFKFVLIYEIVKRIKQNYVIIIKMMFVAKTLYLRYIYYRKGYIKIVILIVRMKQQY